MTDQQKKVLSFIRYFAGAGVMWGSVIFCLSFFASDYNKDYMLSIIGATILVSSMWIFGGGLFCVLFGSMGQNEREID